MAHQRYTHLLQTQNRVYNTDSRRESVMDDGTDPSRSFNSQQLPYDK